MGPQVVMPVQLRFAERLGSFDIVDGAGELVGYVMLDDQIHPQPSLAVQAMVDVLNAALTAPRRR